MTKLLLRYSLAVMTTALGLVLLWQFRVAVFYVLISVTVAATLRPLVRLLIGRSILQRIAWIVASLVGVGITGYLLYMLGKVALTEIQELANAISIQETWSLPAWLQGTLFEQALFGRLLPPSKLFQAATFGQAQTLLPALLGFTQGIASTVSGAFVILVLSFYWVLNKGHFERLWLSLLPTGIRAQARDIWQTVEPDLGAFIRGQIAVNIVAGLLLGLGYWIIGSNYPTLLALVGAFVSAIPFVGVAIAVIIPLVLGLLSGMQDIQLIVLYTLGVMVVLGIWVKPRLFYRRWDNPILTMLLLVGLSDAFGLLGLILAPPLSVVLQIVWSTLVTQRTPVVENVRVSDFRKRQEAILNTIETMEEQPPHQLTNTMERLARLIEKAEPLLEQANEESHDHPSLPGTPASEQV